MATQGQLGVTNVQETLANLGQNRRLVLLGAGVILVVLTLGIVFFAWTKGSSKGIDIELVKSIDQGRAFEVVSKLKANDIEAKISDSEFPGKVNVTVYQKEFDKAAISLARSDLLQEDGFNLFDKSDWAASDYDKRIKMMRAVNGDLSRIISRMSGVKWATVRVNIPEPQLFSQYQAPTTSTVQVEPSEEGGDLTRAQVRSIINLLVGYVPNLQKNNISIIDTNGKTYSAVETEEVAASELLEESERINKLIQKRIEEYLDPLLGLSNFIVRVSSEISRKKIEESATTFAEGVVGQEQIGDERLSGGAAGDPNAAGPQVDGKGYLRSNRVTQKYPSFKQKTVSTPPGKISKITVAVAIHSDILHRISMKQLREGIAAITSPNTTVDDVKITVAEFATNKSIGIRKTTGPSANNLLSQIMNYIKSMPTWARVTVGILLLLFFINLIKKPRTALPESSTIAQINQARQKQIQEQQQLQIPAEQKLQEEQLAAIGTKEPDLSGIISGLQEAATDKPEILASKLQIWLEEGTKV